MDLDAFLLLALVVGVAWFVIRKRRHKIDLMAQDTIERLAVGLMVQYPSASDTEVAQLIRDDLLNQRKREPLLFKWASAETVARMRRTIVRNVLNDRAEASPEEKQR